MAKGKCLSNLITEKMNFDFNVDSYANFLANEFCFYILESHLWIKK